jgi:predicted dienelactone hydrolase
VSLRALALAALIAFAPVAAAAADIEVAYGQWTDAARGGRVVPYKLYLPKGAGPYPLIVHSHGLGGNREASTYILQAVAEAGFIVVTLQHAGSDSGILARGGGIEAAGRTAMTAEAAQARYGDVPFALDQLAKDPRLQGRADFAHIGMSGHSFGALSTLTAVGQRLASAPGETR